MALTTKVALLIEAFQTPPAGYDGGTTSRLEERATLASGTSANQADQKHSSTVSVGASSNSDVDLRALTDGQDTTLSGLTEIVVIAFRAAASNGGTLRIKPSASNGWLGLLSGSSNYLLLKPGATLVLFCPADGQYAVGASTKSINIENTDSAAAGTCELVVIGRSA